MLGFMREILARHTRLDVGRHVRCMLNRIKADRLDGELKSVSHSQVRVLLSFSFEGD